MRRPLSFSFQQVCESWEQLGGFWRMLLLGLGLWHCAGLDQSQARNNDSAFVFHRELRNGSVSATECCCPVHCKVLGVNVDAYMDGNKGYNMNKGRISADRVKLRKRLGQISVLSRYNVVKHLTRLSFLYTSEDVHLITVGYYNGECPSFTPGKLANCAGPGLKTGIGSKSLCFLLTKEQTTSPFSVSFQKIHEVEC